MRLKMSLKSMNKNKLAILLLLSFSFIFFSCNRKNSSLKGLPVGSTIHLFENDQDSSNQEPLKTKQYKVGDWVFSFERIDRDQYEVEKVKQKIPSALTFEQLPKNIASRIGIGDDGLMRSLRFDNQIIKYFPVKKDDDKEEYHFYAYYPQLNMVSISCRYAENLDITSYIMKNGQVSDISPEDYCPDASACFTIKEDSTSLSALFMDVKKQKQIVTFMIDDIESGYASDAYETVWIDNNTALLKVEANNQDEDEYWILKIQR